MTIEEAITKLKTMRVSQTVLMRGSDAAFRRQGEEMVDAIDTALSALNQAATEALPIIEPHNPAAVDHWDCVCLDCQVSSRAERYPEIATLLGRLEVLRSVVALDMWPIDVDCLSVQEHDALKAVTKILPALLRDLEHFHQVGSVSGSSPGHSPPLPVSEGQEPKK